MTSDKASQREALLDFTGYTAEYMPDFIGETCRQSADHQQFVTALNERQGYIACCKPDSLSQ